MAKGSRNRTGSGRGKTEDRAPESTTAMGESTGAGQTGRQAAGQAGGRGRGRSPAARATGAGRATTEKEAATAQTIPAQPPVEPASESVGAQPETNPFEPLVQVETEAAAGSEGLPELTAEPLGEFASPQPTMATGHYPAVGAWREPAVEQPATGSPIPGQSESQQAISQFQDLVSRYPLASAATAFGLGYLLGKRR